MGKELGMEHWCSKLALTLLRSVSRSHVCWDGGSTSQTECWETRRSCFPSRLLSRYGYRLVLVSLHCLWREF